VHALRAYVYCNAALKLKNETLGLFSFIENYSIFHHLYNNPQDLHMNA